MSEEIGLHFGACCDSIDTQLNKQGYSLSEKDSEIMQRLADAITLLNLHDIIQDGVAQKARHKLLKKICDAESLAERDP